MAPPDNGARRHGRGSVRSRIVLLAILGVPVLLFATAALRAVELARTGPVPERYRDLNCDGEVGRMEWLRAGLDYDLREVANGCKAVFHVKTSHVVVRHCPQEPRCTTFRRAREGQRPAR